MSNTHVEINAPINAKILNIASTLSNVVQSIDGLAGSGADDRKKLQGLLEQLAAALKQAALQRPEQAEAVAVQTKLLLDQVGAQKPNKTLLTLTRDGLVEAAKTLSDIAPTVLSTVSSIVAALGSLRIT